jgi:uncharacterized protein (DUF58 family)
MALTSRFYVVLGLGLLLAIPIAFSHQLVWLVAIYDLVLFVIAIIDLLQAPRKDSFEVERKHDPVLSITVANPIHLKLRSRIDMPLQVKLRDEPPPEMSWDTREFEFILTPHSEHAVTYHVTPKARGDYQFNDIFMRCLTPLGFWWRTYRLKAEEIVQVYPNVLALKQYDLLRNKGHLRDIGIRRTRLRGVGTEFEALRDYTPDDEYRRIDWKATARKGKPIVREYEAERSQSVFLVIDTGRNMMADVEQVHKLDHVMNAALMLAYAAVTANDRLGLLLFNDIMQRFVPPKRGRQQVEVILEALHGVQAEPVEPDYRMAVTYLYSRWRKRSLVVFFTDLQEPESSRELIRCLGSLSHTHLCLCVTVADPRLSELTRTAASDSSAVYNRAVALQVAHDRQATIRILEQQGIHVIDSEPERLSRDLVNYYLTLKARSAI